MEMGLKEEAKKKGKTEMGLKEAAAETKKKGKMEMGLPQRLRKRKGGWWKLERPLQDSTEGVLRLHSSFRTTQTPP